MCDCDQDRNLVERMVWWLFWVGQKVAWFRFHRRHRNFRQRRIAWWFDARLDDFYDLYDEARESLANLWAEERHLLSRWRLFEAARYAVFNARYVLRERPFRVKGTGLCPQHAHVPQEPAEQPQREMTFIDETVGLFQQDYWAYGIHPHIVAASEPGAKELAWRRAITRATMFDPTVEVHTIDPSKGIELGPWEAYLHDPEG